MLSEYGQSKAFADGAAGYVRGEGAGVLALKPLAKALADGDPVRAVIRSVDLNQDGRTNGIALPSGTAQAALLHRIYPGADVDPADLDYFEAHGTGTAVGDPTEAGAIGHALGQQRQSSDSLTIGSVKTNIGRLEPAAGLASILKAMLALEHGEIPPSLHSETLNPIIPFDELNLSVAQKLQPLKRRAGAGLVGVNSFGFGGLNGHVIVEGPPRRAARRRSLAPANDGAPELAPWPLPISARSDESLAKTATNLADALEHDPALALRDVALTLWRRRSHLERRAVLAGEDRTALIANLRSFGTGDATGANAVTGTVLAPDVKVAFVFSGNGAQWAGMGQKLLAEDPAFAAGARRASDAVAAVSGMSPLELMAGPADAVDMERTEIAQPLLFALQAGLVAAFEARGIRPDATVGHSVGEIGAAYAAGALDLEQAARVIVRRSEAQAMTRGQGRMAAVNQDAVTIGARLQRLGGKVELAAINSPNAVTLSGDEAALQKLVDQLSNEGVDARMLDLDYAFHSHAMKSRPGSACRQPDRLGAASCTPAILLDCRWCPGVYSMDGDLAPLDKLIEVKKKRKALLMVDEAHALGVLGRTGKGAAEHFGVDPKDVDIWMGTLSKTLSGCGGYIAGRFELVELMKLTAPGFVFSVGMPPGIAAASAKALEILQEEPERVSALQANGRLFVDLARAAGLDVGRSAGYSVVPIIVGGSALAARLSTALGKRGLNVQPITYPAVEEGEARLRFFVTSAHTSQQIKQAVQTVAETLAELKASHGDG